MERRDKVTSWKPREEEVPRAQLQSLGLEDATEFSNYKGLVTVSRVKARRKAGDISDKRLTKREKNMKTKTTISIIKDRK